MSKEAMKLALEALENSVDLVREDAYQAEKLYGNYPTRQGKINGLKVLADDHEKAITALKTALAEQPAQQEPEWYHFVKHGEDCFVPYRGQAPENATPLYTSPPAQPTVPDALTPADKESPKYTDGWNDCRELMLRGRKI